MALTLFKAFLVGGLLCAVGQILIDKTNLTPARILIGYLLAGIVLSAVGLYQPLVDFAGAGASTPLSGFGHVLAQGAIKGAHEEGLLGAFLGAARAASGGVTAAVVFSFLNALVFSSRTKT